MASGSGQAPVPRAVTASALSRATRPFTLGRWIGWVTASESLGFLVPATGLAVASLVPIAGWEAYVMIVMLGAVEGALLGLGQVAGLRDTVGAVPLGPWVTVTAGGAAVAWSLGMLPATLSDVGVSVDFTLPATWFAFGLGGLALLTAIPVAQWTVLRHVLPRAWRWIPVGVGAWLAGLVFPFLPGPFVDESTSPLELAVLFALAGLAMAATVATVTGLWLRRVLPHRRLHGYSASMTPTPDDDDVDERAELLPEELAAGSDDPAAQAQVILEESENRTLHPEETRHESSQTPDDNRPG